MSSKQVKIIIEDASKSAKTEISLDHLCKERYGKPVANITNDELMDLKRWLNKAVQYLQKSQSKN